MKIIERIFDEATGETTNIEREMTAQEIAEVEKEKARIAEMLEKEQAAKAIRTALLSKLGITEEEAKLLLS